MSNNFIVHYPLENNYKRCYHVKTDTYTNEENLLNVTQFHLQKSKHFNADDAGLKQYATQLILDADELASNYLFRYHDKPFHYLRSETYSNVEYFRSHGGNITKLFKMFSGYENLLIKYKFENINATEALWMSKCPNGGQYYTIPKQDNVQSYGYDCSNFYGSNMSSKEFKFPIKCGKEYTYTNVRYTDRRKKLNIKFGYYHVKIECHDEGIKKLFAFSKYDVYTSESVRYAYDLKEKHNYNFTIDIVMDDKPNAYIYTQDSLITGDKVFGVWFKNIVMLKKEYPKNIILKMLSSSLWGHLSAQKVIYKSQQEVIDEKINIGMGVTCDYKILDFHEDFNNIGGSGNYKLLDNKQPYKFPLRLKSFLTSYCRNKIADIALKTGVENILRIHTDGIVYSKPMTTYVANFIAEEKCTGVLCYPIRHCKKKYELK